MNKLSKREKIEITIIAVILVLFVYFKFIVSPISQKNSELSSSISQLNSKYDEMNLLKSENSNYQNSINKLKNIYNESIIGIPLQIKDAEIENTISTYCTKEALTINTLSFNAQTNNTNQNNNNNKSTSVIIQLPLSVTVTGSYGNIVNLISDMERDQRIFNVKDFSISSGNTGSEIKATISGVYYYSNGNTKPDYNFNSGNYGKTDLFN